MRFAAVLAVVACASGCVAEDPEFDFGTTYAPIVGGVDDLEHDNVVGLITAGGACTATVIADRVVLTAAHCVENVAAVGQAHFGTSLGLPEFSINVSSIMYHRYYDPALLSKGLPFDIALVLLRDPVPAEIEPMPFREQPLPDLVGDSVVAVGFGAANGNQTGAGVKRRVTLPVNEVTDILIGSGDDSVNTCQGDSGGPILFEFDGVETVIGITSTGPQGCIGNSHQTRVDAYLEDFLYPVLDSWDGPCKFDGECDPERECRNPDPDCDGCAFDGFCAKGCPVVDQDCPVAGFAADLCKDNDGCESRLCVAGLDDPRVHYCSNACDPSLPLAEQCEAPLAHCVEVDGVFGCYVDGPSPSAQGARCDDSADCRSGACDSVHDICVEQCGDGFPACAEGFSCEKFSGGISACTVADEGCGCASASGRNRTGNGGAWLAFWLAVSAALFARRRRAFRARS